MPTGALLGSLVLWAFPRQMTSPLKLGSSNVRSKKIALLYLLGACLMALPALLDGVWLWFIWISVSLLMVSFAYLTGNANIFQKQANGKLSAAATVLLLPYLVGVRLNMAYWLRGKAKTAQVRMMYGLAAFWGISNHLPAVLDVCAEYPCRSYQGEYRALPLLDMVTPSENDLVQTALILETLCQKHGKVLVCCALGYGRSAAVVLTWLLVYGGCKDLAQAKAELQQASTANGIIAGHRPSSRSCGQPFKTRIMMNNATDSRITAHLLSIAHYVAACNALLLALSAKYGGAWFAVQLVVAVVLLYCHIRIHFDRRVFQDFADNRYSPEDFDYALQQNGLRQISGSRTLTQRINGALSLWRKSLYLTAAQFLILLIQSI